MLSRYLKPALLSVALAFAANSTSAALVELNPTVSGSIRVESGAFPGSTRHSRPLTSIRGNQAAQAQGVDFGSYLIFDTSPATFTPRYATLLLNIEDTLRDLAGPGPLEIWGLDTYSANYLLGLPEGSLGSPYGLADAILTDLQSGTSLASDALGPLGEIAIALNSTAIAQITAANGLWGLGLYDNRFGALLGGLDLQGTPRLLLSDRPFGHAVPVPATQFLVLVALALLTVWRAR